MPAYVDETLKCVPSVFHVQSTRLILSNICTSSMYVIISALFALWMRASDIVLPTRKLKRWSIDIRREPEHKAWFNIMAILSSRQEGSIVKQHRAFQPLPCSDISCLKKAKC